MSNLELAATLCLDLSPASFVMEISNLGSVLESARELTLEAANSAVQFIGDIRTDGNVAKMLASPSARDQYSGVRAVLADAAHGQPPNQHFAGVVKLASSPHANVRRLVYQFVAMYGAQDPNLALMTINAIQKTLGDKNPVVRALALRTISSMPLPSVAPIVAMNVRSMSTDKSPLVRSAAARALAKCHELDSSLAQDLISVLDTLLGDPEPSVQSTALAVVASSFASRLDLLHKHWAQICANLPAFDSFNQAPALDLLVRYCRVYMGPDYTDTKLLLSSVSPLLKSPHSDVIVAACAAYIYLEADLPAEAASALANLNQTQLVLENALLLAKKSDKLIPYLHRFLLRPQDTDTVKSLKLQVLAQLADASSFKQLLGHLKFYALAYQSPKTLSSVFETLTVCAIRANAAHKTVKWLVKLVSTEKEKALVAHALLCLRVLMPQTSVAGTLQHIATLLDQPLASDAKATILWLVGESAGSEKALVAEVLRKQCLGAATAEDAAVRLQTYQLAAKLLSCYKTDPSEYDPRVPKMCKFAIQRGLQDPSFDARDRCRMFASLLFDEETPNNLHQLLLQLKKLPPSIELAQREEYLLGSSALAAGRPLLYYVSLQDWGRRDKNLRQVQTREPSPPPQAKMESISRDSAPLPTRQKKVLSLDEFLGGNESESESESETETESESETE